MDLTMILASIEFLYERWIVEELKLVGRHDAAALVERLMAAHHKKRNMLNLAAYFYGYDDEDAQAYNCYFPCYVVGGSILVVETRMVGLPEPRMVLWMDGTDGPADVHPRSLGAEVGSGQPNWLAKHEAIKAAMEGDNAS